MNIYTYIERNKVPLDMTNKESREREHEMLQRLEELKAEYAEQRGWSDEEYWYEDDDLLYEAECYAYEILEKEYNTDDKNRSKEAKPS
jgi:hypothetical protein